jgi:DNA-binding NarL/FixJ family response regulator
MSLSGVRLMLVDDHPMVREGLRARLQKVSGIEVVAEAGSAVEALAALATTHVSLVLMDVGMKEVDGIELTARVVSAYPGLRVLMFSMYDNPEFVQRALQAGASGYLLKDAPAGEIISAIEVVSSGATYLSPGVSGRLFRGQKQSPLLTPRESEILAAIGRGESSKRIAAKLNLSFRTIDAHRQSIKRKLDIDGQAELIRYAVEHTRTDPST